MAPKYKLTYLNAMARGEAIRFLLSYGGMEFEDFRIEYPTDWPNHKPNMPFGQVPVLEVDGKVIWQSAAICRYLAKQVGLCGKDDWENLEIDAIVDTVADIRAEITLYKWETDEAIKESRRKILFNETYPYYFKRFDNIAKENNGYLAIGRLTWADFFFVGMLETWNTYLNMDVTSNYSNLQRVKEHVISLPAIKAWIEKRPVTLF